MSAPSPLKGGLYLGGCGFLCYWGGFCLVFVDIVIGDTIYPQVFVYLSGQDDKGSVFPHLWHTCGQVHMRLVQLPLL